MSRYEIIDIRANVWSSLAMEYGVRNENHLQRVHFRFLQKGCAHKCTYAHQVRGDGGGGEGCACLLVVCPTKRNDVLGWRSSMLWCTPHRVLSQSIPSVCLPFYCGTTKRSIPSFLSFSLTHTHTHTHFDG